MENPELQNLADYSPADKTWDEHRSISDDVGGIYLRAAGFERYGERVEGCSGILRFGWSTNEETGETRLRLRDARFCRVRHCPICQWRRSLMWQARFYQSLPKIVAEYPDARWLFLTLTVRNCPITELGDTLTVMKCGLPAPERSQRVSRRAGLGAHDGSHPWQGRQCPSPFSYPADGFPLDVVW